VEGVGVHPYSGVVSLRVVLSLAKKITAIANRRE
jgi:hypothetical protein